jgi:hypothetical protein
MKFWKPFGDRNIAINKQNNFKNNEICFKAGVILNKTNISYE